MGTLGRVVVSAPVVAGNWEWGAVLGVSSIIHPFSATKAPCLAARTTVAFRVLAFSFDALRWRSGERRDWYSVSIMGYRSTYLFRGLDVAQMVAK